jgi:polar amino acid transport system substrate-binding protein
VIEGVFAVRADSDAQTLGDIDHPGVRIGVKRGSAYDLYLTRTLQHADVVRGEEGVDVFLDEGLDVVAGIRQPMAAFVQERADMRLIDERFMQIQQAVGTTNSRRPETVDFLRATVEDLKVGGFVSEALLRSGQAHATVAAPA